MQRKTVTISRELFQELKEFSFETRSKLWFYLLDNLFDGKNSTSEEIPEDIKDAYVGLKYEFNRMQKQFTNGKKNANSAQKNSKQNSRGLFCPLDESQLDPTRPNLTQNEPSSANDINVNYNISNTKNNYNKLNKNNNIYNIYTNTNKQTKENTIKENKVTTELNAQNKDKQSGESHNNSEKKNNQTKTQDPCDFELTSENHEKAQFYCSVLQDKSECIADNFVKSRFLELIQRLCQEQKPLKIKGVYTSPDEILNKLVNLFAGESDAINQKLIKIFAYFDDRVEFGTVKNTYKYLISILYNVAREQVGSLESIPILQFPQKQPTTSYTDQEIMRHNYTQEQLNSIYDSLDNIEI